MQFQALNRIMATNNKTPLIIGREESKFELTN